jgi:hypothetical protein
MSFTLTAGTKVTGAKDPVTVTVDATATVGGRSYPNGIAIEFTGTECHVIQIFIRTKIVDGTASTQTYGQDQGGVNTIEFVDPNSPSADWQVDTKSASSPYYDFGYAHQVSGNKFGTFDAPTMTGPKYNLPGANDVTTFDAYAFCISDKDIIAIVKWDLDENKAGVIKPSAVLLNGADWWSALYKGRKVLTKKGYNADVYLPTGCMIN